MAAVLIYFDEQTDRLHLATIGAERVAQLNAQELGYGIEMSCFREVDPSEAERRLGAGVLTLLNSLSQGTVGVRDYEHLHDESVAQMDSDLRARAEAGDVEAAYDLHHLLFAEAMSRHTTEFLSDAERFLQLAAHLGHPRALDELKDWPRLKQRVERRAKRTDT